MTETLQEDILQDSKLGVEIDEDELAEADLLQSIYESQYFDDPRGMASLTPASLAAIARLRAYKPPPFSTWDRLPLSRRASVLVLLFAGRQGDLRVVITMRASTLRNYSGQAAFPGGKADTLEETPFKIARREAWEEIGLPNDDSKIPAPFRIEHLCEIPFSLAKTALAVRPCVAFLHSNENTSGQAASVEDNLIPKLDAREVAAVFSAPFHNFLKAEDEVPEGVEVPGKKSDWYHGKWTEWDKGKWGTDGRWRMHNFHVPINNQIVTCSKPKVREGGQSCIAENIEQVEEETQRYLVWGMTARILVDAARIAYGEEPEFEYNIHFGDEELIESLEQQGKLGERVLGGPDLTNNDNKQAKI